MSRCRVDYVLCCGIAGNQEYLDLGPQPPGFDGKFHSVRTGHHDVRDDKGGLFKPGTKKQADAKSALKRYSRTFLPVYAIKEWKAGPLVKFAWLHDKFVQTRSLRDTHAAIEELNPYKYFKPTVIEAWTAAGQLEAALPESLPTTDPDRELANRYRLALASLIFRSWQMRRQVADETVDDLECYTEASPVLESSGFLTLDPNECERNRKCALKNALSSDSEALEKLRDAIPKDSKRGEDIARRRVLKDLIKTPKATLEPQSCRRLGDAVFAFFCPKDAVILTTNIKDHRPLARALGKEAEKP